MTIDFFLFPHFCSPVTSDCMNGVFRTRGVDTVSLIVRTEFDVLGPCPEIKLIPSKVLKSTLPKTRHPGIF